MNFMLLGVIFLGVLGVIKWKMRFDRFVILRPDLNLHWQSGELVSFVHGVPESSHPRYVLYRASGMVYTYIVHDDIPEVTISRLVLRGHYS